MWSGLSPKGSAPEYARAQDTITITLAVTNPLVLSNVNKTSDSPADLWLELNNTAEFIAVQRYKYNICIKLGLLLWCHQFTWRLSYLPNLCNQGTFKHSACIKMKLNNLLVVSRSHLSRRLVCSSPSIFVHSLILSIRNDVFNLTCYVLVFFFFFRYLFFQASFERQPLWSVDVGVNKRNLPGIIILIYHNPLHIIKET